MDHGSRRPNTMTLLMPIRLMRGSSCQPQTPLVQPNCAAGQMLPQHHPHIEVNRSEGFTAYLVLTIPRAASFVDTASAAVREAAAITIRAAHLRTAMSGVPHTAETRHDAAAEGSGAPGNASPRTAILVTGARAECEGAAVSKAAVLTGLAGIA